METANERLYRDDHTAMPYIESPNVGGQLKSHDFIVMHYTEGSTARGAIDWLTSPKSRVSAHLVIARDGTITQLVPFNIIAWHAGQSYWEGSRYLNSYSIGIEMDNAGRLTRPNNVWRATFKKNYPDDQVMVATHKFGTKPYGWHIYTPEQIQAVVDVCKLLVKTYGVREIIGHEDICPKTKWDPGPAFPMEYVRTQVFGLPPVELARADTPPVV